MWTFSTTRVRVAQGDVEVAEIPERPDAQPVQLVGDLRHALLGDAEDGHNGLLPLDKGGDVPVVQHRVAADLAADHPGGVVKHTDEGKPQLVEGHVPHDGPPQVARADEHALVVRPQAQDLFDLAAQLGHVVAVALLPEAAKAIQVLADLGGGKAHLLRELLGGDAGHALVLQLREEPVVPGQPADDRHGNGIFFLHGDRTLS